MPWTHDVGSWYWHTLRYPGPAPAWERAWTTEVEEPYRAGRGLSIRLWGRRSLVVGRWHHVERGEEEALQAALGVRYLDVGITEIKDWAGGVLEEGEDSGGADRPVETDCTVAGWRISGLDRAEPLPDRPGAL